MTRALISIFCLGFLVSCAEENQEGLISKTSTNTGLTCQNNDGELGTKAIYGIDNRLDWFESPGQTKDYWARATLALIPNYRINTKEGKSIIT
ncbi:MAG: hypothetical protein AAF203_09370, partial [Pseudomonadota bacterium]